MKTGRKRAVDRSGPAFAANRRPGSFIPGMCRLDGEAGSFLKAPNLPTLFNLRMNGSFTEKRLEEIWIWQSSVNKWKIKRGQKENHT